MDFFLEFKACSHKMAANQSPPFAILTEKKSTRETLIVVNLNKNTGQLFDWTSLNKSNHLTLFTKHKNSSLNVIVSFVYKQHCM